MLLGIFMSNNVLPCYAQDLKVTPGKISAVKVAANEYPTEINGASIFQVPNYFVWGGTVVKGKDGKYHMLCAMWESGAQTKSFTKSWVLESKIGYAVSDFPDKDFKFQKIVLKGTRYDGDTSAWDAQMVHNPHVKKFNDKYYLYYIGSRDPGVQPKGSSGEGLDLRTRVQQSQCTGVIEFDNFEDLLSGNFKRPKEPLLKARTRVKADHIVNGSPSGTVALPDNIIVVNPSVDYNPNTKKYMLFFKGNLYEPTWKGAHGVAISGSPTGPFTPLDNFVFDVKMPDGKIASTEDPYVWYATKYQKFLAIVKDFTGRLTGNKKTLALLSSSDGITWELTKNPLFMKRELNLMDGVVIETHNLERPQLIVDSLGIPQVLFAACSLSNMGPSNDGRTFNVHIPLIVEND